MRPSKNPSLNFNLAKLQQPSHTALHAAFRQLFARPTRPGPPWAATMRRPRGKVRPGPWPELPTLWAGLAMLTPPTGWATRAKTRVACDPARPAAQHTKTADRPPCRPVTVFVHCASGFLGEQLPPTSHRDGPRQGDGSPCLDNIVITLTRNCAQKRRKNRITKPPVGCPRGAFPVY